MGVLPVALWGSSPTNPKFAGVAQLVEHLTFNQGVGSSSLLTRTTTSLFSFLSSFSLLCGLYRFNTVKSARAQKNC